MIYNINYNGFHGNTWVAFHGPLILPKDRMVNVSKRVARRLNKIVCPYDDCECGEEIAEEYEYGQYRVFIPKPCYFIGRYPQP
jgi:hypothetical protein